MSCNNYETEKVGGASDAVELVREFHEAFLIKDDLPLRRTLIGEEIAEFVEAVERYNKDQTVANLHEVLKEAIDVIYVLAGTHVVLDNLDIMELPVSEEEIKVIEHIADASRNVFGAEVLWEAFQRVHESNMSKLGDDGKPMYREDGKVLKSANYVPPNLTDLVEPIYNRLCGVSGG